MVAVRWLKELFEKVRRWLIPRITTVLTYGSSLWNSIRNRVLKLVRRSGGS